MGQPGVLTVVGGDMDWVRFVVGVGSETAPGPLVGFFDQAGFNGIAMHVAEFFDFL